MKKNLITKKIISLLVLATIIFSFRLHPFTGTTADTNPIQNNTFSGPPPLDVEYDV